MPLTPELASDRRIMLIPLDEPLLGDLLTTAVQEAEPTEVMPGAQPGVAWGPEYREAFLRFHLTRSLTAAPVERTYAVVVDGTVAGAARLAPADGAGEATEEADALEAGVWLGRRYRDGGIGKAVLRELVHAGRMFGGERLLGRTSAENVRALHLLGSLPGAVRTQQGEEITFTVPLRD